MPLLQVFPSLFLKEPLTYYGFVVSIGFLDLHTRVPVPHFGGSSSSMLDV